MLSKVNLTTTLSSIPVLYWRYTIKADTQSQVYQKYFGIIGTSVTLKFTTIRTGSSSSGYSCPIHRSKWDFATSELVATITNTPQTVDITKNSTAVIMFLCGSYFDGDVDIYNNVDLNKTTFNIASLTPIELKNIWEKAKAILFSEENIKESNKLPCLWDFVKQYSNTGNQFTQDNAGWFACPEKGYYNITLYTQNNQSTSQIKIFDRNKNTPNSILYIGKSYWGNFNYNTTTLLLDKGTIILWANTGTAVSDGYVIRQFKIRYV